jgi:ribose transport system substrate-binding protein
MADAELPAAPALCRPFLPSPRRRFRIGFSAAATDNPWRVALVHSVEHAAARCGDALQSLVVTNAEGSAIRQIADIEQMAADGVDGILVDAVSPHQLMGVADRLMQDGIPVVFINRGGIAGMPCLSFVTSNNRAIGRATARWLAETIRGQGAVLMLYGHADPAPSQSRHAAALAEFARYPGIRVERADVTNFRPDHAREAARHAIENWGDRIAGVWWCSAG